MNIQIIGLIFVILLFGFQNGQPIIRSLFKEKFIGNF